MVSKGWEVDGVALKPETGIRRVSAQRVRPVAADSLRAALVELGFWAWQAECLLEETEATKRAMVAATEPASAADRRQVRASSCSTCR